MGKRTVSGMAGFGLRQNYGYRSVNDDGRIYTRCCAIGGENGEISALPKRVFNALRCRLASVTFTCQEPHKS